MPIDPLEHHQAAIADLSARHRAGEMDREAFLSEAAPHARVIAALEGDAERDGVIALARVALANPLVLEAVAVGAAHYFRKMKPTSPGASPDPGRST